jgi:hypothetical protein
MSIKDASNYLSLSAAIETLKTELLKAATKARKDNTGFLSFKECEIELALEFEPNLGVEFNLGVFKVSTGAGVKGGHKVVLRFDSLVPIVATAGAGSNAPPRLGRAKPNPNRLPRK